MSAAAPAVEFHRVSVDFPMVRIPSFKEWMIRAAKGSLRRQRFHALHEVSHTLEAGRCLGIIGRNGAGKSTLLRVAAGVILPSSGEAIVRGSVAPLIELGTGFDYELSGRENIFFNGALLGRSRALMTEKLDEIIDFSGLEAFIDAPLRTYSTGMAARLAFSIATTVDAGLVLLDEILSVGDAAFQQRCEERILSFYRRGCTILLVSHDLAAIRRLCDEVIWLHDGVIRRAGAPDEVIEAYEAEAGPESVALTPERDLVAPTMLPQTVTLPRRAEVSAGRQPFVVFYPRPADLTVTATLLENALRTEYPGSTQPYDAAPSPSQLDAAGGEDLLVFTDPLMMPWTGLAEELRRTLHDEPPAQAAVPITNISDQREQCEAVARMYRTPRQYEEAAAWHARKRGPARLVDWGSADPGVFLIRRAAVDDALQSRPASDWLFARRVAITPSAYAHRFPPITAMSRPDLVTRLDPAAKNIVELYCGTGNLGRAIKAERDCRIIGIEPIASVAEHARGDYDEVIALPLTVAVDHLTAPLDAVVAGERFASEAEPVALLARIRPLCKPGAQLLLSLHNIAGWPVIADLVQGRFDYSYMGHITSGSLRFFTRASIEQFVTAAGWQLESIEPQPQQHTAESRRLLLALDAAGIPHADSDLGAAGFYVIARA